MTFAWTGTGRSASGSSSATGTTAPTGSSVEVRTNMPVVLMFVVSAERSPARTENETLSDAG